MSDMKITCVPQLMEEWGCDTLDEFYFMAEAVATAGEVISYLTDLIRDCENHVSLADLEDDDEAE